MNIIFRHINISDYHSNYFELLSQLSIVNNIDFNLFSQFIDKLNDNHQIIVIQDLSTNKIIGTGTIIIEYKIIHDFGCVAHIEDVVIDTTVRGCGIGYKLINYLKEISIKMKAYKIILDCSDMNTEFYIKCGFENKNNQMSIYL
jgi:glucosamine-phosphate N-acetyltransferase